MDIETRVRFTDWEREVFEAAQRSIFIGFPNPQGTYKNKWKDANLDGNAHATLRALLENTPRPRKMLEEARGVLVTLLAAVEEQAHRKYFLAEGPPAPAEPLPDGTVPLILDPVGLVDALIEIRQVQMVEVARAIALIDFALGYATAPVRAPGQFTDEDLYERIMEINEASEAVQRGACTSA